MTDGVLKVGKMGEHEWLQSAEEEIALKKRRRQRGCSLLPGTSAYSDCVFTAFESGLGFGAIVRMPSTESDESGSSTPRGMVSPAASPSPNDACRPPRASSIGFRPHLHLNCERTSSAPPIERQEEQRKTKISLFQISYSASPPPCQARRPVSDTFVFDPTNVVKFTSSLLSESDIKARPQAMRSA